MKTTLNIDDTVMLRLKQEAARQRRTMSEIVESNAVLQSPGLCMLKEGPRHAEIVARLREIPGLQGNVLHDLHTAALMREHGVRIIYTRASGTSSGIRRVPPPRCRRCSSGRLAASCRC